MAWRRNRGLAAAAVATIAVAAWAGGCGSGAGDDGAPTSNDDGGGGGDGGTPSLLGGDAQAHTLTIVPAAPTLDVNGPNGPPATLQLQAKLDGQPVSATWTVDTAQIGSIDAKGLFTATGTLGGVTTVHATVGSTNAETPLTVRLHLADNPGNVGGPTQGQLQQGGSGDPAFKWLYPYDRTVFPRGLLPPTLQLAGAAPDAVYVHIASNALDYKGFYTGANARVDLAPALWKTITESAGASDPVKVEVTKISGGKVAGPIAETWTIAQGSLKGTVYYNSYSSPLAGSKGAVLRIRPGAAQPDVLLGAGGNCTVCHAVSADGSTIVASHADYTSGAAWDLTKPSTPVLHEQGDSAYSFGALTPDGKFLMSNGALSGDWPPNVPGQTQGPRASRLYETATGTMVTAPGWDSAIQFALTPVFSQDGKRIAFNRYDATQGHTLSVMDYDAKTHAFSGLVDVASDGSKYLGWPAFLPDSSWVIYHSDDQQDLATWNGAKADLMIAHVPSKTVARLDALDGFDAQGNNYLPYGDADAHVDYEPTVLPVAVGGYYWVVFTSRRNYGNEITGSSQDDQPRKKLWVAAIDIDDPKHPSAKAHDLSHPPFYLSGQEFEAGNMRGFWALDPCQQNGTSCDTGDECCSGYCRATGSADGGTQYACVPPPSGCANEFEKCNVAADCCGADQGFLCLNGHCARPAPR